MFSRYGFEKKVRCENRDIINVLPVFFEKVANPKEAVSRVIDRLIKTKELSVSPFFQHKIQRHFNMGYNTHKSKEYTACVLAPAGPYAVQDLRLYSEHETRAWIEALIRNVNFVRSIKSSVRHKMFEFPDAYKTSHYHEVLRWIADCRKDKKYKDSLFRWVNDSLANVETITEILVKLGIIFARRRNENAIKYFAGHADSGKYGPSHHARFTRDLVRNMYEPDVLKQKGGLAKKGLSHHKEITSSILAARDITLSLVPKHK
jgi:hypothetical protein